MKIRFLLFASLALWTFSGCAWITEPLQESADRSRSVPAGTLVDTPLFSARTPVDGLVVFRDNPRPGFLSLRFPFRWNGSYNIYPFALDSAASPASLRDAWYAHLRRDARPGYVERLRVVKERMRSWQGYLAWYHEISLPNEGTTSGLYALGLVAKRGDRYFYISRSMTSFGLDPGPTLPARMAAREQRDFERFLAGIVIK